MSEPQAKPDLFKELVWDLLVKAVLSELFLLVPLLAWGPFPALITLFATHFTDKLYTLLKLTAQMEKIMLVNEAHRKAFDNASIHLAAIAHDKGPDSPEFKEARDAQKQALSQFVRFA